MLGAVGRDGGRIRTLTREDAMARSVGIPFPSVCTARLPAESLTCEANTELRDWGKSKSSGAASLSLFPHQSRYHHDRRESTKRRCCTSRSVRCYLYASH